MIKRHRWNRRRSASGDPRPPFCAVCNLEATMYRIQVGAACLWVSDTGEVWGSHVAIRYPRARLFCSGRPESTEAYRI